MPEPVKARRRYVSPAHAELRRRTRRSVIDAARRLFAERGYGGTTIEALAKEAGVAVQTVYAAFGNKRSVLWAVLEAAVAGDDEQRTIRDRIIAELEGLDDPQERLERVLAFGSDVVDRSVHVYRILQGAAAADHDLRSALGEVEQRRYLDAVTFMELITDRPPDDDLVRRAADVFYVAASYEAYELLVIRRGWTSAGWQRWAFDTVASTLGIARTWSPEQSESSPKAVRKQSESSPM